jgi:hypothetical protein
MRRGAMKGDVMEQQRTCGMGLAEHSVLPAKMGELLDSVAENLELHMQALDLSDSNAKLEYDAYLELANEHRAIATQLQATAKKLAGCWDLPMGRHDQHMMSAPRALEAFQNLVKAEQELQALLHMRLEEDQKILQETSGATGSA